MKYKEVWVENWKCPHCGLKLKDVLLPVHCSCALSEKKQCRYLGEFTGEYVGCRTCRGKVRLKVFECERYNTVCTAARTAKPTDGVLSCPCSGYAPSLERPAGERRLKKN